MSETPPPWPELKLLEQRILGVLVEKAKTTPDVYPMSLNSIVTGCNQKSNRDPLMNVDDIDVEQTLDNLQERGLVIKVTGGRVDRWRQALYEVWTVTKTELAILAELLLRGAQTEGELRSRASRMEPIDDIEQLREILKPLAERELVLYLSPERSRGALVTHGFIAADEQSRLAARQPVSFHADEAPAPRASVAPPSTPDWKAEIARLESQVGELRSELTRVTAIVESLRTSLGA